MVKVTLPYIQRFEDRHGKVRYYTRRPGFTRTALPGTPTSPEFMAAYHDAMASKKSVGSEKIKGGSISALIVAYYQSAEWKALQPSTRQSSRLILDRFREAYGEGPANSFKSAHLRRILDKKAATPSAAKNLLKRLKRVFAFGMARNLVASDPTQGVTVVVPKSDGFRAWTDSDITAFEAKWPAGSRARLALYLLLYSGQRRSDIVRMGRQHLEDGALNVRQQKTGAHLAIPIHPKLQAELDRLPSASLTFLMTVQGKPFGPVGFSNWFSDCARKAGLPSNSSPHGVRKAAARRLAEAGCSISQIASITGHTSLKEVERYTKSAQQKVLAQAAMAAIGHR